jgi:hypothetical protein
MKRKNGLKIIGEGKIRIDFDLQSLYEGSWKVTLSDVVTSISFEACAKLNDFFEKIKYSLVARIIFKPFWDFSILPINQTVHISHIDHMINWAGSSDSGKRGKRHDNIRSSLNPTLDIFNYFCRRRYTEITEHISIVRVQFIKDIKQ